MLSGNALPRPATRVVGVGAFVCAVVALALVDGTGAAARATRSPGGSAASNPGGLDVLPFPGTPDAAPDTNIDFPAISPSQIASVRAVGSRSGVHAGHLSAQPDHAGTAFSPERPFANDERVSVTATLRSAAAGTASGAPGARRLSFSFSVQRPLSLTPAQMPDADAGTSASGASTHAPPGATHSFVTEPGFQVPWIRMTGKDTDTTSGDILLDAQGSGQNAVYILNGRGQLLWYRPTGNHDQAYGLREQRYRGQPVLTYWEGTINSGGLGQGKDLILNDSYRVIHTITPVGDYKTVGADQHEITLTRQGTALITLSVPVKANLTSVGGPADGMAIDFIIQDINIATGRLVWEWHALGHVPIRYTHAHYVPGRALDFFHLNSIQELPDGHTLIVSARHTWAVYSINMKTGDVTWELGGKHSSFHMGPGTNFEWQHDATLHSKGLMTVFDDAGTPKEEPQSRALEIHLNMTKHQATLVRAFTHKPPVSARSQGSVQLLAHGDVFVGWGTAPTFSEYDAAGRQLFSGSYHAPIQSYRAYRFPWSGHPKQPPAIAVKSASTTNHYTVYASWNGATQVARWQVLVGDSSTGPFKAIKRVSWASFETQTTISTSDSYFKVQALGIKGKVLRGGTSAAVKAES